MKKRIIVAVALSAAIFVLVISGECQSLAVNVNNTSTGSFAANANGKLPDKASIIKTMRLVNDYWLNYGYVYGEPSWPQSVYSIGNMAMYDLTKDKKYLQYSIDWSESNEWKTFNSYETYGPTDFADFQACGQTYLDIYKIKKDPKMIKMLKEGVDKQLTTDQVDNWCWIDAIFMAGPMFAQMGELFNDKRYFDKMYALYEDNKVKRQLYDSAEGLWYNRRDRDTDFMYPGFKTANGFKCFWSRGNGWVFAAHALILSHLPKDDPHRDEYISTFQSMAATLKKVQREDGFWRASLYDYAECPNPESSGTSLFAYGMAWGIDNGYLDYSTYYPCVAKAWNGLIKDAVHPDGVLGYVQAAGNRPVATTYGTTKDYGVGVFLLAGSEIAKLSELLAPNTTATPKPTPTPAKIIIKINNKTIKTPYDPILVSNAVLVPAEAISKSLGAKYIWNSKTKSLTISKSKVSIFMKIDSKTAKINGKLAALLAAPRYSKVPYVPIQFLAEKLGYRYKFDAKAKVAAINK